MQLLDMYWLLGNLSICWKERDGQYLIPINNRFKEAVPNIYQGIFSNLSCQYQVCAARVSPQHQGLFQLCLDSWITIFKNCIILLL